MEATDLTQEQLTLVRSWRRMQDKIMSFERNANEFMFRDLYGGPEAERLIHNYVFKCGRNFDKFLTYLTRDQSNKTFEYILKRYV